MAQTIEHTPNTILDTTGKIDGETIVMHTPKTHGATCKKCQDHLHRKEFWTKDDCQQLRSILSNYE